MILKNGLIFSITVLTPASATVVSAKVHITEINSITALRPTSSSVQQSKCFASNLPFGHRVHSIDPLFQDYAGMEAMTTYNSANPLLSTGLLKLPRAPENQEVTKLKNRATFCRTPTRSDHEVRLSRPPPPTTTTHHPRHLAQRLKSALLTVPRPQTLTFSESS